MKRQDDDLEYLEKGVVQATYKLLAEMEANSGRARTSDIKTLTGNIKAMIEGVEKFKDKYQEENFRAHCSTTSYLTHIMSTKRKNHLAAGKSTL